jgi:LCP family protein required for cell wall assembly
MERVKIDFLKEKYRLHAPSGRTRGLLGRVFLTVLVVGALTASAFSYHVASGGEGESRFPDLSVFSAIRGLMLSGERKLNGEADDRVNFLLLGVGGAGHEGPQLSDTMIFASWKPSTDAVGMISIPRDLTAPIPGYGWRKINHANAFGEQDSGKGPELASDVVSQILDEPVHYFVRVDFDGFAKLVDDIGGLDVYVDRAFTDAAYPVNGKEDSSCGTTETILDGAGMEIAMPTYGCRFEVLSFAQGWTHMDGETVLKFVRSRHGNNGEASDFARSRRQQKIITGVKDKVLSAETLLNPARVNRIFDTLKGHIATNFETWELVRLANSLKEIDTANIVHHVLDASEESPLYATSLNGAYVLLPKNDDWRPLQAMADDVFAGETAAVAAAPAKPPVRVEIQNGTGIAGLAFRTSQLVDGAAFDVVKIGNAENREYEHTVIYDLTGGMKPDELRALRDQLRADVTLSATSWIASGDVIPNEVALTAEDFEALATEKKVDFLVILGEQSANLVRR